jgi:hypothetical protein
MTPGSNDTQQDARSPADPAAVREQLDRLVLSSHFNHSRRFPTFLRYVVEHTLSGQGDNLKERTLGIEVFGRGAEYDTASDPIVRVTAAEIRKRIAQYYGEPGHETELRLSLPSGSYVPHFHWPGEASGSRAEQGTTSPARPTQVFYRHPILLIVGGILLFAVGLALGWRLGMPHRPGFDYFWNPILRSSDPVLFCIADQSQYTAISLRDAHDPNRQTILKDNLTAVVIDDLNAVIRMAGVLQANGKPFTLLGENATTLTDLRNGTSIVVGAFDNAWTLRLTQQLRYHFDNAPDMSQFRIVDSGPNPHAPWAVDREQQLNTQNYKDYAIVARFTNATTGKLTIIAAGVARGGTIAAGEYLSNPDNLNEIEKASRASGGKSNLELVLSTQIINGDPGKPRIEAAYFW